MTELESILERLIAYQTITGERQAAHELLEYVASFVTRRGMHVERYISNGFESLVATTKAGDKTPAVMLGAHADVVAAPDEMFRLRKDGDKLYGRGVEDMKFALAAYLDIIDGLTDRLHQYSLGLMVTTDEEVGGNDGTRQLLREGYRPGICLLPDGGDNWQIQTSSKGILNYKLIAHGVSSHSSRPWLGDNAIKKLLPVIPELETLAPQAEPASNLVTVTGLAAGGSVSQIPDRASLTVDIRTIDKDEHRRLADEVRRLTEAYGLELHVVADGDPTYFDLSHPLIAPYARLIETHTGTAVTGSRTLGTSDVRFLVPYGLQCISFYPTGGGHHSPDEWLSAKALEAFRTVTAEYLDTIALTDREDQPKHPITALPVLRRVVRQLRLPALKR